MTDTADNDVAVLFPDQDMDVRTESGTESITVREFRFGRIGQVYLIARELIEDLANLPGFDAAGPDTIEAFDEFQMRHWESLVQLMVISTGKPREWIEALPDSEGSRLREMFWTVNIPFFMRRLFSQAEVIKMLQQMAPAESESVTS